MHWSINWSYYFTSSVLKQLPQNWINAIKGLIDE